MKRILLVEDEAAVADYLSSLLQQEGFEIIRVPTLEQAKSSSHNAFDLILLDLNLPDGTGDELLPHLRDSAPNTPILIVTGASQNDERLVKCLKSGAAGYVRKSARVEELILNIRRALRE
jgi:DNA-binding response OmpR family regulator